MVGVKEEGCSEVAYEREREKREKREREGERKETEKWNECVYMCVCCLLPLLGQKEGQCFVKGDENA